jgi:feruloyl esterase
MHFCARHLTGPSLVLAAVVSSIVPAAATCNRESLAALAGLPIETAASFPGGTFTEPLPSGKEHKDLQSFCRVTATLKPSPDSNVKIEVWMPDSRWNKKFLGTGNGGYAGAIDYLALAEGVRRGYAVANTDMGTSPPSGVDVYDWLSGSSLVGLPEKWKDFGYRSTHAMTVAAKSIVKAFYGSDARQSYFVGCSTGGQQALVEAQRFPDDYDGIIAGAPGNNRTHLVAAFVWSYRATRFDQSSYLPHDKLLLLNKNVLEACGTQAGGLPTDGFLADPRQCHYDPVNLKCTDPGTTSCLTDAQVQAARSLYAGPSNPNTHMLIYPGWPRGSEGVPGNWVIFEGDLFVPGYQWQSIREPAFVGLFKWVFGANWDWRTFNFDTDMANVDGQLAPIVNAMNADLAAFQKRGGKLLLYHGWADAVVAAQDTINYYNRVVALQGGSLSQTQKFARLFLAPGMAHCSGGPGPSIFNGAGNPGAPFDPQHDILMALDRWVSTGVAPTRIIATRPATTTPTGVTIAKMTRPLCPYPQRAQYKGAPLAKSDADSFKCIDAGPQKDQVPAREYQK